MPTEIRCGWCPTHLGWGDPEGTGISHGICASCLKKQKALVWQMRGKKAQVKRATMKATARGINPGIGSALWGGAKAGYYTYRAGRLEGKAKKYREKASAAYKNPRVIPGTALEIRYRRATDGKLYYHPFMGPVTMVANGDGSVTLRGGKRIWADDRERGFWERYGHTKRRRNPSMARRRRRRRGGDNTMLWLLGAGAAFLFWPQISQALGVATGGAVSTGGQSIIPQGSDAIWFSDSYTGGGGEFFVGALPPGSAPPWRLASTTEIGSMEAGLLSGYLAQAGGGLVAPAPGFMT